MTRKELLVEAELGFAPAQYQVGVEYYAEQDLASAVAWYRKAAEGGFAPAQSALGDMYSEGLGVEKTRPSLPTGTLEQPNKAILAL